MSKKPRTKRKKVGDRSAETGQFVSAEYAAEHPAETVAVTVELPTAQEAQEVYVDAVYRDSMYGYIPSAGPIDQQALGNAYVDAIYREQGDKEC